MSKVIVPGWFSTAAHRTRCIRCNCIFEYDDKDIYEKMTAKPNMMNPFRDVEYVVDCPECGWMAPACKKEERYVRRRA